MMRQFLPACVFLMSLATLAFAQDRPTKDLLTPASFPQLHAFIQPEAGEYRWDEIHWIASIWHARKQAAEEDKPIFIFGTAGAGFNDPLGNC
jgi:hypothetical protein